MRRACRRLLTGAAVLATLAGMIAARAGDDGAERARLRQSWSDSCQHLDRDWPALEACNLAWFRAHEEAVWRFKLNPHGAKAAAPSS